MRTFIVSSRQ
jgi:calcium-binding protein CML